MRKMELSVLSLITAIIIAALIAVAVTWAMASLKLDKISGGVHICINGYRLIRNAVDLAQENTRERRPNEQSSINQHKA